MKEPVDHILRPRLPWRTSEGDITECGYDASKVKAITREEYVQRRKDLGQQRCAMMTCMTCSDTAQRWASWEQDPRLAVGREINWETGGFYYRPRTDRGARLKDELLAIAELIENHREEFDALVENNQARREWIEKKAARRPVRRPDPPRGL